MPKPERPVVAIDYAGPGVSPRPRARWWLWLAPVIAALLLVGLFVTYQTLAPVHGSPSRGQAPQERCVNNLRQIGLACLMYANEHANQFPDTLSEVLRDEDITPEVFVCPSSNDTPANGPTTQALVANLTAGGHLSYIYVGKGLTSAAPATAVLAYEPMTNTAAWG